MFGVAEPVGVGGFFSCPGGAKESRERGTIRSERFLRPFGAGTLNNLFHGLRRAACGGPAPPVATSRGPLWGRKAEAGRPDYR